METKTFIMPKRFRKVFKHSAVIDVANWGGRHELAIFISQTLYGRGRGELVKAYFIRRHDEAWWIPAKWANNTNWKFLGWSRGKRAILRPKIK